MMSDEVRTQLTTTVIDLLDQSFQAYSRGDRAEATRLSALAADLDLFCVNAIIGGMQIGEIPRPETTPEAWAEYVMARPTCPPIEWGWLADHATQETMRPATREEWMLSKERSPFSIVHDGAFEIEVFVKGGPR
jgi:hypothetical protein